MSEPEAAGTIARLRHERGIARGVEHVEKHALPLSCHPREQLELEATTDDGGGTQHRRGLGAKELHPRSDHGADRVRQREVVQIALELPPARLPMEHTRLDQMANQLGRE